MVHYCDEEVWSFKTKQAFRGENCKLRIGTTTVVNIFYFSVEDLIRQGFKKEVAWFGAAWRHGKKIAEWFGRKTVEEMIVTCSRYRLESFAIFTGTTVAEMFPFDRRHHHPRQAFARMQTKAVSHHVSEHIMNVDPTANGIAEPASSTWDIRQIAVLRMRTMTQTFRVSPFEGVVLGHRRLRFSAPFDGFSEHVSLSVVDQRTHFLSGVVPFFGSGLSNGPEAGTPTRIQLRPLRYLFI